jgi:serine protease Do
MRRPASLLACLLLLAGGPATAGPEDDRVPPEVRKVRDMVFPALVRLDVVKREISSGTARTERGLGSGVVIGPEGYVLTNFHVAGDADQVWVTLFNKERVKGHLIGADHWTDLAVVQIDAKELAAKSISLHWAHLGDSDAVEVGQPVLAMGTPFGLSRTMTQGIVSNAARYFSGAAEVGGYETGLFNLWIQHDAAINPGNSGGPLVDFSGGVIGINTRGAAGGNNIGFAVPSNVARQVADELIAHGKVTRSYAGVGFQPMADLEQFFGVDVDEGALIGLVVPDGPAYTAGIRPDDILLKLDDEAVNVRFPEQLPPLERRIANCPVGTALKFTVKRRDRVMSFTVRTELLESAKGRQELLAEWGATVRQITAAYVRQHKLADSQGVLVEGVEPSGLAAKAGLRGGDILRRIDRQAVADLEAFKKQYEELIRQRPQRILIELLRGQTTQLVVIKSDEQPKPESQPASEPAPRTQPEPPPETRPAPMPPTSRPASRPAP